MGFPLFPRRWRVDWTRYWCFKTQRRDKRIVPTFARPEGALRAGAITTTWPSSSSSMLGLSELAPPSSPVSFVNSSAQSPANFSLSLAAAANLSSPGPINTMFTIGPYAHETQLVSPPVLSTFTTEPSTGPFTPPPELAHLVTTPSSPDVPYAYIASSREAKGSSANGGGHCRRRENIVSPLSTSAFASPCDTPACYTPVSADAQFPHPPPHPQYLYHSLYSCKEVGSNPPMQIAHRMSPFPTFDPFASSTFDGCPFASFILPSESNPDPNNPSPSAILRCDSEAAMLDGDDEKMFEKLDSGSRHNEQESINIKAMASLPPSYILRCDSKHRLEEVLTLDGGDTMFPKLDSGSRLSAKEDCNTVRTVSGFCGKIYVIRNVADLSNGVYSNSEHKHTEGFDDMNAFHEPCCRDDEPSFRLGI